MAEKLIDRNESAVDREIVFTRVFDAPRRMVWEAWTDPKQLVLWWGPKGFTTTIDEMDVRAGGVWKHRLHQDSRESKTGPTNSQSAKGSR